MWKDMDLYMKRDDDDSAIGDSANNSAEEEISNPGRKSVASDDSTDLPLELHSQLSSKIGIKIPNCLLKESEKSQQEERRSRSFESRTNVNRNVQANSSACDNTTQKRKGSNQMDLQLQLNYLLHEMRNLRELDRDILRKFIGLNDCIEEVRWRLADNEAKFQRKLAEDDADEDFFSSLTETRLDDLDAAERDSSPPKEGNIFEKPKEGNIFEKPRTLDTQSYNAISSRKSELSKSSKPVEAKALVPNTAVTLDRSKSLSLKVEIDTPSSSMDNPTYSNVDEHIKEERPNDEKSAAEKDIPLEKLDENNCYRIKPPYASPSDVWVAREKDKMSRQQQQQKQTPRRSLRDAATSKKDSQESATSLARKYNDLIIQKQQHYQPQQPQKSRSAPRSASFKSSADETPKINHRTQWQKMEKQGEMKKVSDFQKQKDYQNLLGLSRVKGRCQVFQPTNEKFGKTSDSSGSLNSNSSGSSSSLVSPSRDLVTNNNRWNRVSARTRSSSAHNANNSNNFGMLNSANHLPPQSLPHMLSRDLNVMAVPNKRASESSIYNWIRQQKDVSFL